MIVVIQTPKPEALSIVAGECGAIHRATTHGCTYSAAIELLKRCHPDELRQLELHDLRRLKQRAAGVVLPEPPATDRETNAVGSL